ncbi:MAG TPA: AAA family ATPase [Phycisphaerales bacterium]|nr:AAA family ATPase [Phycisphaerales bacterium]
MPRPPTDTPFLASIRLARESVPSFDAYPFSLPAVSGMGTLAFHPAVTFLVGENGSGKSTLLEGIAVALGLNPEGGSRNFNFATRASHSPLSEHLVPQRSLSKPRDLWFLRAESFFNVASEIERLDQEGSAPRIISSYGGRSLHEQSHGESFFALFRNRFGGGGLYLLDEPEAALSPMRQLGFLSMMHDLIRLGSQFVIATHSPIIMAYPQAWIYSLGGAAVSRVRYEETEHYRVTRGFLNHPARSLEVLMDREPNPERPL